MAAARCRFTGIDTWNLCVDGEWVEEVSNPVQAYDAGTDSGLGFGTVENFVELDIDTDPAGPIVSFGQIRPKEMSTFYNPSQCASACAMLSLARSTASHA